jgi:hypothetical protein
VTILVPLLIADVEVAPVPLAILGALLIAAGIAVWAWTVGLFARIGKGTLAPWDQT